MGQPLDSCVADLLATRCPPSTLHCKLGLTLRAPLSGTFLQTWCLTSTETIRLIRDGEMGGRVWSWGEREIIYLSLHCNHQNDSCIKMGSDESHFDVSLIARDKVTRQCPQTTTFKEKGEPKRIRTEVLLLSSKRLTARPNRRTISSA